MSPQYSNERAQDGRVEPKTKPANSPLKRATTAGFVAALVWSIANLTPTYPVVAEASTRCEGGAIKPFLDSDQDGSYVNYGAQIKCVAPATFNLHATLLQKFPNGQMIPINNQFASGTRVDPTVLGQSKACINNSPAVYVTKLEGVVNGASVDAVQERQLVCTL